MLYPIRRNCSKEIFLDITVEEEGVLNCIVGFLPLERLETFYQTALQIVLALHDKVSLHVFQNVTTTIESSYLRGYDIQKHHIVLCNINQTAFKLYL